MDALQPVTYEIEIDTKQACDLSSQTMHTLWFSKLTIECEPPLHFVSHERVGAVAEFLDNLTVVPYQNLADNEDKAVEAGVELKQIIERLRQVGLDHDFVHDGRIKVVVRLKK